jgi:sugar-specific transcriptional regulator TrmB
MMNRIIDYLEQLNLSDIEAKLYLELLKTGPISVRELAKAVGMKRTTAYFHIDMLTEKGLVMKIVNGSHKQVAANPPEETLKELVEQKLRSAKESKEEFPTMLKDIKSIYPAVNDVSEAEIKYYKGKNGVKKIYEDVLKAQEVRSYVNIAEIAEVFPENSQLFDDALKANSQLKVFEIVDDSPETKKRFETVSQSERYFYKLLPAGMKLTAQDILIYDNKVAIIHFKDKMNGVVLRNADLYNNFKLLFDFVWKTLA